LDVGIMRTVHLVSILLAAVSMTLFTGCDWYREYRISNTLESANTKVDTWRHEMRLPVTPGTDEMGEEPGVELLLGPNSIRAHNTHLVRRWVEHDDASRLTPNAVSSRLEFHTSLNFDTDASEGLGNKQLEETLSELHEDALIVRDTIEAESNPEILLTIDERVSFRKVTEVVYSAGQAGYSRYEVLTRSSHAGDSPSTPEYTRFGLAFPSLGPLVDDQNPPPSCVRPGLTRVSNGVHLQLTNSAECTDGRVCLTAGTPSDQSSTSSKDETSSPDTGTSDQNHREHAKITDAPIRSANGECPIPAGHGTQAIINTLNHIDTHANLCNHGTVSAMYNIRWGRIAGIIPAIQRDTPVEYVALSRAADNLPNCENAMSPPTSLTRDSTRQGQRKIE
jgi:hypothetical protein